MICRHVVRGEAGCDSRLEQEGMRGTMPPPCGGSGRYCMPDPEFRLEFLPGIAEQIQFVGECEGRPK